MLSEIHRMWRLDEAYISEREILLQMFENEAVTKDFNFSEKNPSLYWVFVMNFMLTVVRDVCDCIQALMAETLKLCQEQNRDECILLTLTWMGDRESLCTGKPDINTSYGYINVGRKVTVPRNKPVNTRIRSLTI